MKVGVLGLGSIGFRHARNLIAMGHHVMGYDPLKSATKLLHENGTQERDKVIMHAEALVVASPTKEHLTDTMSAIKIDVPVLVEKPLFNGPIAPFSRSLIADGKVWMGNMLRFHPCVMKAKEWMPQIGKPYRAHFNLSQQTDKETYLTDGVVFNWGSHEIDLALHLLGDADVKCTSVRWTLVDDLADTVLLHKNDCLSAIHLDFIGKPFTERWFTIHGDAGRIKVDILEGSAFLMIPSTGKGESFTPDWSWNQVYTHEMHAFLGAIKGENSSPIATGKDGLRTYDLMHQARDKAFAS